MLAVAAGLAMAAAFPTMDLWWLAPVGVAALSVAVLGARARLAAGLGLLAGLAFFLPTLSWTGIYVGHLPWFALATTEALYVAVMCLLTALVQRPLLAGRLRPLAYAVVPLMWVLQEWARSSVPFGGFPWARLAFSQADSPLVHLAAYAGAPGVTAAVAAVGVLLHAAGSALWRTFRPVPGPPAYRLLGVGLTACALVPALASPLLRPPTEGRPVRVLAVQGNVPKAGLDFNAQRRKVLDNHVQATLRAIPSLGGTPPSLVVWPENASDIDPLRNPDAGAEIRLTTDAVGAPLLLGAVLDEPSPDVSNASLLYRPGGGAPERYIKQHPVPFAEYIPYRSFFRHFSDKVDLVAADFAAGDRPGAFRIEDSGHPYWAIPTICFEVAYDDLMRTAAMQPGKRENVLVVQTNNATFGRTAESEQQFAISRLRAVEHGRSVVHISTVGVSGFIAPDGTVSHKTSLFTAAAELGTPVVRSSVTVSDRIGDLPEYLALGLAAAIAALALWQRRRPARVVAPTPEKEDLVVV